MLGATQHSQNVLPAAQKMEIQLEARKPSVHLLFVSSPSWFRCGTILALTLLIAWADVVTPPYIYMTGFYLLPIFLAVWYEGNGLVTLVVVISTATSLHTQLLLLPTEAPVWHVVLALTSIVIVFTTYSLLILYLRRLLLRLQAESHTDSLTGLRSRRHFLSAAQIEIHRSNRSGDDFTFAIIDLDNFKQVNDSHGHARGDALLVAVSNCMLTSLRDADLIGRLGGDEFAVALPNTGLHLATEVLGRLHRNLSRLLKLSDLKVTVTASIGAVAVQPGEELQIAHICEQADAVMYRIKHSSKNAIRVERYQTATAACSAPTMTQ